MGLVDVGSELVRLVVAAQGGDQQAFGSLYEGFGRVVHGIALAHVGSAEADDLTQDVFVNAFVKLPELREPAAFPGWLCQAARHAAIDRQRRRRSRPVPAELIEVADPAAGPAAHADQREQQQRVLGCIAGLPEAYRETLVLRLCEGLTGPEIAARTGMTHGSVRVNLTRGMQLLRTALQEAGLP